MGPPIAMSCSRVPQWRGPAAATARPNTAAAYCSIALCLPQRGQHASPASGAHDVSMKQAASSLQVGHSEFSLISSMPRCTLTSETLCVWLRWQLCLGLECRTAAVPFICRTAHWCSSCTPTGWMGNHTRMRHGNCCIRSTTDETSQPPWPWLGIGSLPRHVAMHSNMLWHGCRLNSLTLPHDGHK
jgi:hypothetical protein